jgi:hypothetical protein
MEKNKKKEKKYTPEQTVAKEMAARCCKVCTNQKRLLDGRPVCQLCWPFWNAKINRYILARYRRDRSKPFPQEAGVLLAEESVSDTLLASVSEPEAMTPDEVVSHAVAS